MGIVQDRTEMECYVNLPHRAVRGARVLNKLTITVEFKNK